MTHTKTKPLFYTKRSLPSLAQIEHDFTNPYKNSLSDNHPIDELLNDLKSKISRYKDPETALRDCIILGMRAIEKHTHLSLFDTQVLGALSLVSDTIAEMKTGEGKTLTACLATIIYALMNRYYAKREKVHIHVVTVNDYLAKRDFDQLGDIYRELGLSVGLVTQSTTPYKKQLAYSADITYVTNSELGFDYLRDNLVNHTSDRVLDNQFDFVIVDEADSILIDEAKTPLIIASESKFTVQRYQDVQTIVQSLSKNDYKIDKPSRTVSLTASGHKKIASHFEVDSLYDDKNVALMHLVHQAMNANYIQKVGVDYLVSDEKTIALIDAHTGRVMKGRRYNDGLMEAIEAKEGVEIHPETQTAASITYQNLFKFYPHLSGMTGTAYSEREELKKIYDIDVVQIPTHKPLCRVDAEDDIFKDHKARENAVIEDVKKYHAKRQPILVAAENVVLAEQISKRLLAENIPHRLLTAKDHYDEARIIAQAGEDNAITVTTNMAGRGTDIKLTGSAGRKLGLRVLGIGRNDAKRIDDQLRGRAGRQGDEGFSKFYVSLEDRLITRLADNELKKLFANSEDLSRHIKFMRKMVDSAQRLAEGQNYDMRKQTLEYGDVLDTQRKIVYAMRDDILTHWMDLTLSQVFAKLKGIKLTVEANDSRLRKRYGQRYPVDWLIKLDEQEAQFKKTYVDNDKLSEKDQEQLVNSIITTILNEINVHWSNHMNILESLRSSMNYRSYAQTNPLIDYVSESHALYEQFLDTTRRDILVNAYQLRPNRIVKDETLITQQRIETARKIKRQDLRALRL